MPRKPSKSKISPQLRGLAVPIGSLVLDPENARRHDRRNIDTVKASLVRFGQLKPIVVQAYGRIVRAGNATVEAAIELGWTEIAANMKPMTDAESRAYAIVDNRSAELAAWDDARLVEVLGQLQGDDSIETGVTGFTDDEIAALIKDANPTEIVEDEVPEPQEKAITKPGDLWVLGEHRVLCGDSTKGEDVGRVMGGEKAQLVWTDPPYGVDIQERDLTRAKVRGRRKDGKGVANDDLTGEQLCEVLSAAFALTLERTIPGACWYVCAPPGVDYRHPLNILAELGVARHGLVWVKDRFVMGRADYHYRHENLIYGWSPDGSHKPVPTRDQGSVWEFPRPSRSPEHPTMKPVKLVAATAANSSKLGDNVLDPFLGSGTTLIAAEQLGRRCFGIEIEPRYVDVTVRRWQKLTGKRAKLEGSGKRFPEVAG